jgi:hypothetical protein
VATEGVVTKGLFAKREEPRRLSYASDDGSISDKVVKEDGIAPSQDLELPPKASDDGLVYTVQESQESLLKDGYNRVIIRGSWR